VNSSIIFVFVLLALLWLLMIRPQRRRQAAQQQLWGNVKPGDEIVTAGGLYGEVVEVEEGDIRVRIAENTVVRIALRAVAGVVPPDEEPDDEAAEPLEQPPDAPAEPRGG
jgi:preprotein translocase subunit YajC